MNFVIYTDKIPKLEQDLGYSMWNIAVNKSPYRTGNLRRNISLQNNGPKVKRIYYNDFEAKYLHYLEEGMGRVKKHKGFIGEKTVGAILSEVYSYILTGKPTFYGIPTINLRTDRPRNYERTILQQSGISIDKRITASDRAMLSRIQARKTTDREFKGVYTRNMEIPNVISNKDGRLVNRFGTVVERK